MVAARQRIIDELETLLNSISVANEFNTDFESVKIWDDVPLEYSKNLIVFKDPREIYEKKNKYEASLRIEIIAVVIQTEQTKAGKLGNLALEDLTKAVLKLSVCRSIVTLVDSYKWVETKGKTACQIELNIDIKYQF